ncbi:MAG: hypothetical protein WCL44_10800 [bacterium]
MESTPEKLRWPDRWLIATIAIACCVMGLSIYRAATQSITHDESITYVKFIAPHGGNLFGYTANNHILHTWMVKGAILCFGTSELVVRTPALAGAALYLAALVMLALRIARSGPWLLVVVALGSLNPLVMDFLACARGYSLALAFLMWAVFFLIQCIEEDGWTGRFFRSCAMASLFLGLCIGANLSFLFGAAGVGAVSLLMVLVRRVPKSVAVDVSGGSERRRPSGVATATRWIAAACCLAAPGLCTVAALYVPYLGVIHREEFYAGHSALSGTGRDLIYHQFFYRQTGMGSEPFVADSKPLSNWLAGVALLTLLGAVAAVALVLLVRWIRQGRCGSSPRARALLLLCASACLAAGATFLVHVTLNVRYPVERTALYFIPLVTLGLTLGVVEAGRRHRWVSPLVMAMCLLVVLRFVTSLNVAYFRIWKYDADSRAVFGKIQEIGGRTNGTIHVGGCWFYKPSMNFYRVARHYDRMLPYTAKVARPVTDYDLLVLNQRMAQDLNVGKLGFVPVFHGRLSGVVLYANPKLVAGAGDGVRPDVNK